MDEQYERDRRFRESLGPRGSDNDRLIIILLRYALMAVRGLGNVLLFILFMLLICVVFAVIALVLRWLIFGRI